MQTQTFINPDTYQILKEFGLPTLLVLILMGFLFYLMKRDDKRQIKSDKRYEDLVNRFISEMSIIRTEHAKEVEKMLKEFHTIGKNIEVMSEKLNNHDEKTDYLLDKIRPITTSDGIASDQTWWKNR